MNTIRADFRGQDDAPAVREGVLPLSQPFPLHLGGELAEPRLAWRLTGSARLPVVVALGGISAHRRVFDTAEPRGAWWQEVAGPGRALDSRRVSVLGIDYIGGSGGSSRPPVAGTVPGISSHDQAHALRELLDHLGLGRVRGIVGASYGGMVALAFASHYPQRLARLVVLSAAERAHPMATAWRSVQRRTVRLALRHGCAAEGLELARALAMTTYRSPEEFAARFDAAPELRGDHYEFPVEGYIYSRGREYAGRVVPEEFLCLSESIDLHRVDASGIQVPTTVVAVREDRLVPLEDMRALAARLPDARLHELSSPHGHDAFLKEPGQLRPAFDCLYGEC